MRLLKLGRNFLPKPRAGGFRKASFQRFVKAAAVVRDGLESNGLLDPRRGAFHDAWPFASLWSEGSRRDHWPGTGLANCSSHGHWRPVPAPPGTARAKLSESIPEGELCLYLREPSHPLQVHKRLTIYPSRAPIGQI